MRRTRHELHSTPSPIAASLAQGVLQQSQQASATDKARNEAERFRQKLREMSEKKQQSVQDSYETTDDHLKVEPDGRQEDAADRQPSTAYRKHSEKAAEGGLDLEA